MSAPWYGPILINPIVRPPNHGYIHLSRLIAVLGQANVMVLRLLNSGTTNTCMQQRAGSIVDLTLTLPLLHLLHAYKTAVFWRRLRPQWIPFISPRGVPHRIYSQKWLSVLTDPIRKCGLWFCAVACPRPLMRLSEGIVRQVSFVGQVPGRRCFCQSRDGLLSLLWPTGPSCCWKKWRSSWRNFSLHELSDT